jgi:peptidoglycan hydrolase CwlO-like protein
MFLRMGEWAKQQGPYNTSLNGSSNRWLFMENKERLAKLESRQETLTEDIQSNREDIQDLYARTNESRGRIGAVEKDVEKILENQDNIRNDIQGISRRVNRWFLYTIGGTVLVGLAFMIMRWSLFN